MSQQPAIVYLRKRNEGNDDDCDYDLITLVIKAMTMGVMAMQSSKGFYGDDNEEESGADDGGGCGSSCHCVVMMVIELLIVSCGGI